MDGGEELGQGKGLGEEAPALEGQLLLHRLGNEAAGDHEDGEVSPEGFELAGEIHTGAVGHVEIGDEEIDVWGGLEDMGGAICVAGTEYLVALVFEESTGEGADIGIVVDQEDGV